MLFHELNRVISLELKARALGVVLKFPKAFS